MINDIIPHLKVNSYKKIALHYGLKLTQLDLELLYIWF